ncbi:DUF4080 domain-containing protein [Methylomonas sp. HYX-M1]|uniref:B12-binding domain-containing radical SAM protein n=1 Tax=Methylomonas sp. HYX-M1 TaxID=3139307 RepID=UPI00345B73E6
MPDILLTTLNARYIHSAFGLRYLFANMGALQPKTELMEFGIKQAAIDIAETLLSKRPAIVGFGVYIWNVAETQAVIAILKQVAPNLVIVLGGPEVSYPPDLPDCATWADYIITGPGEISFPKLCEHIEANSRPNGKILIGEPPVLAKLPSPYPYYSDPDILHRIIYVEASRGCPYKCEFCLSSLDLTAKAFPLEEFLGQLDSLYQRGARHFKFIDRTFNLKIAASIAILEFFLTKNPAELFLHFEVVPDNLPEALKRTIQQFPPGCLQFEVGVQTLDPNVQQRISRKQDNQQTLGNLRWLRRHTGVYIHADLIVGLPGESLAEFGLSFDQLIDAAPQEIQVGILKRLRGAPLNRHIEAFQMRFDPNPPYSILSTREISFHDMQRLKRFAKYWDLLGNSGRFVYTLPLILGHHAFERFLAFSDALYQSSQQTHGFSLKRLFEWVYQVMAMTMQIPAAEIAQALLRDFAASGEKGTLNFNLDQPSENRKPAAANKRQLAHSPDRIEKASQLKRDTEEGLTG